MSYARHTHHTHTMTNAALQALLAAHPADVDIKLSVLSDDSAPGTYTLAAPIGGVDLTIEPSEDWPNAIVLFADAENRPS